MGLYVFLCDRVHLSASLNWLYTELSTVHVLCIVAHLFTVYSGHTCSLCVVDTPVHCV